MRAAYRDFSLGAVVDLEYRGKCRGVHSLGVIAGFAQQPAVLRVKVIDAFLLSGGGDSVYVLIRFGAGVNGTDYIQIAESAVARRGHDICAFAVFVPGREHDELVLPAVLICVFGQVFVANPEMGGFIVFNRHHRVANAVPWDAVEADAYSGDGIHRLVGGAVQYAVYIGVDFTARDTPVVCVAGVEAHFGKRIGSRAAG